MELPIRKVSTWVKRHPGYEALGHSGGGLTGRSWVGWLLGPNPFGVPGQRIDLAFLGRLAFRPSPFGALGLGWLAKGTELGPMVPIMPPFSFRGGTSSPVGKKKRNALNHHIIGNSRPSMLLNFQRKFCNFFEIALDAIGSFELILRFRGSYKRLAGG